MSNFRIAVKFSECSENFKKTCLYNLHNNGCLRGNDNPCNCKRLLELNPLCFCTSNKCKSEKYNPILFKRVGKDLYMVFSCNNDCKFFLKGDINKTLKTIGANNIIYGEDLDKMLSSEEQEISTHNSGDMPELEFIKRLVEYVNRF